MGIKWGVESFCYNLYGRNSTLITDHAPLRWLQTSKMENSRLMRWALALQPFSFSIKHQPGLLNIMANFLLRIQNDEQLEVTGQQEKLNVTVKLKMFQLMVGFH